METKEDVRRDSVLRDDARKSRNFYQSDLILNNYLRKHLPNKSFFYVNDRLEELGEDAAQVMDELSLDADQNPPELVKRSPTGEAVNKIDFHPSYRELLAIAARSEMIYAKYHPETKGRYRGNRHRIGFALGQVYAMAELGVYCPLCMTDGAAYLLEAAGDENEKNRLLPHLAARNIDDLYTGAMFITEKSGGSDVGAIRTAANRKQSGRYELNGEKWFCSNVNAEVIMTLARTGGLEEGTWGLSLFMIEKYLSGNDRNPMDIIRLKEKMGVRSMATGEVLLENTVATRLGENGQGFKLMSRMINISRIYNSVAAVGASRRALIEAYQYLNHRETFGKRAIRHPLVRDKFRELGSLYVSGFYLLWRAIEAMDKAEDGNDREATLLRILTPMVKWWTAEKSVYIVRECMELLGGNGYIEDFVMPKIFRDVNVLPIWEGTSNMMVLDILRAAERTDGMDMILQFVEGKSDSFDPYSNYINDEFEQVLAIWQSLKSEDVTGEQMEITGKSLFGRIIKLYQMALLMDEWEESNSDWISPTLSYLVSEEKRENQIRSAINKRTVDHLISWEY